MKTWIVYIDVSVEADSAAEAEKIAMDDIRGEIDGWSVSDVVEEE